MSAPRNADLRLWIRLLRPQHWIKNLFVLAGGFFGGRLHEVGVLWELVAGVLVFCLCSSAVYAFNDAADAELDRKHPDKRHRPVASGAISPLRAMSVSLLLAVLALGVAYRLDLAFANIASAYLLLNLAYSWGLKRIVILDVMLIALGFVLRVLAGTALVDVAPSPWILSCTGLLALFLGFSKRRQELLLITGGQESRTTLNAYTIPFLDQLILVTCCATFVSYLLFTVSDNPVSGIAGGQYLATAPFVLYGLFRYLFLLLARQADGNPTDLVLTDRPLQVTILGWALAVYWIRYGF